MYIMYNEASGGRMNAEGKDLSLKQLIVKRHVFLAAVFFGLTVLFMFFQNFSKFESYSVYPAQVKYSEMKDLKIEKTDFTKDKEFYTFITAPSTASRLVVCYNISGAVRKDCNQPVDGVEIDLTQLEPIQKEAKKIELPGCPNALDITFNTYRVPNQPKEMGLPEGQTPATHFDVSAYVAGEYNCGKGFVEDGVLRFSHVSNFNIK